MTVTEKAIYPSDIRAGDRIRVRFPERGGVTTTTEFTVRRANGISLIPEGCSWPLYDLADLSHASVELVHRPVKRLAPGTVTRSANGTLYVRTEGGFFNVRTERFVSGGRGPDVDVANGVHEIVWSPES